MICIPGKKEFALAGKLFLLRELKAGLYDVHLTRQLKYSECSPGPDHKHDGTYNQIGITRLHQQDNPFERYGTGF